MGIERNLSDTVRTSGTVEAMWGTEKEPTGKAVAGRDHSLYNKADGMGR